VAITTLRSDAAENSGWKYKVGKIPSAIPLLLNEVSLPS
jgi:hypothetical protein